ncbi:FG-GAP-like repeat-containing protein [Candidatus Thiodubiliella endoseptemdiera]|uniref:FG-GAP-like repeat-containing protein n=1 Tax=Candidatus Thiodubiliella endoseptemdiera TaxID=2738886 RepID=UPI0034DFF96A
MPGQTKYFISNTNGFFVNWYSDITGLESHGQALKASGNSGDDAVYVGQGTKVDATGLTSTGGNDLIYLTGTFNNYEQTLDGNTYTFKRTVNINGTEYQEEVSFTASNGDRVYFADGFVKIDISGTDGLLGSNGFKKITSSDIDNSESTPGLGIGLSITDDKSDAAKVGEDITYTFTFDEAVTDFDINDITVTGGTKGTFTSVNGSESVYTLELTPPANSKGIISLTVAVDAATSKINTALKSAAASNNQSFDTQAPTLIISDDKADTLTLKTGDTITYTFTFSEAVTGFDKSVINISNGAIKTGTDLIASTTPADAGKVYTLTVVPGSDLDVGSNLTVSVSANPAITDSAGNAYSTTAANNEQAIDTKAPVATLSGNMAPNENLTMTFLEAVTINTAGSIVIYDKANPGTLITIDIANQVSLDSTNKIITINPGSDLIANKNYYVKIDAGTFKDTAGNNYEGIDSNSGWGFLVYSFTTTAQWVDASGNSVSDNGINASEFSTLAIQGTLTNSSGATGVVISAITFKATSGTTANDKVVETSNLPTFASANGTEWTLANSKIPTLVSGETYTIEINLSSTGGGTSTGGNTTPVLIDTAAPIITSWAVNSPTDGQSGFKVDDVIELTMTTNEALSLSNATSSKVTIGNKEFTLDTGKGAAKAGASVDELKQLFFTYTVKVDDSINKADFEITSASAIALTGVTDAVGNIVTTTGTYPIELDRNVDGVVPTIGDITLNWGDILNAIEDNRNGTVTVATTGVENNQEVSLVINQKTYTGTVTSNSATITVTATDLQALTHGQTYSYKVNIKDTASNPAIEKIGDFKVDTVAPTLTITDNEDATTKAGEEIIFTFTFNEVVTEFTKEDIVITNGTIKGAADLVLVTTGVNANKAYTLVVVPNTDTQGNLEVSVAADKFVDIAGNRNMVAANDIQVIDTLAPNALTATALISAESNDVVVDNTAPILTTQASAELGETSDLILDFNEDIQAGSTGSIVIKGSDDRVIATINITETTKFSIAGDKLTIDVSALGLTDNKLTQGSYYITMDAGTVTDIAGNDAAAITKDTNQWVFATKALFTTIAWIGADDNYINDSEKDATTLSGKATGIGTLTITKIEFFEGSNTVGTAITSGLPVVAADGTWALAHSAMPSELADGKTYTAVVTLSDGTNSAISTSTAVTYDTINPTPITTNPWTLSDIPAGQSAFKVGDVISLTLTMSETLKLNNTTGSKVVIAGKDFVLDKTASTTAGDKKLVFKYSVQAGDSIATTDFDIDNPTSDITLNNITDVAGNAPVFTADRVVLAKTKLEYIEKTGLGNNPFEGIDVGYYSTPTLADIDGDGDLDLVVGKDDGTLKYYQNTGSTSSPAYEAKTGGDNPFNGIDVGYYSTPTLADIDGDGDLDLVVGENDGPLKYYQNTGTTSNPAYEAKTGDDNPFNGIDVGIASSPTLADIDGDGDLDLVVGGNDGTLKYYQNTGTTSNPAYEAKTGDSNPFNGIDVGYSAKPTLADIDGDGDLDLVMGESYGTLKYYQNTGTTSNPAYEVKTGDSNPFNGINVGIYSAPTLADIDGDGDLDLVVGEQNGTLKYYYNQQPSSVDGQAPTPTATNSWTLSNIPAGQSAFKAGDVISLTLTMSETLKLNNTTGSKVVIAGKDFVLDKTASTTAGDKKLVFKYSVQAGDSIAATDFDIDNPTSDITLNNITDVAGNAPVFTTDRVVLAKTKLEYIEKTGLGNNPFEGIDVGYYSTPTLADIDGDGDLDLVVGKDDGTLKYYQNTGSTSSPAYEAKTGGDNPFNGIDVGYYSTPTLADIDGDGDLDLVVGENDGPLKYYQNTGTTSNPAYEAKTGDDNPFNGIDVGIASSPTLADIDGDGDLDLVVGGNDGTLKYYQNTGTTSNPAYEAKTGDSNPFNGIDVGYSAKPTLADIDGDGDLDLVMGESYGTLKYYQNTGTTSNPAYEVKTGDSNPFNGINVGIYSAPTLADIDGDGDLDLVVGEQNGTLKYYYNQQPSSVDGQAPTPTATNSWTLSNIPAGQSAFKAGDVISLTLTMSETLKLNNTTGSKVVIAGKDFVLDKTASTTAGDKKLVFKYSVQAGDSIAATDFDIDNPTSDITLNNITDVAGNAPVFTADRVVLAKVEYIEKTGSGNNPFEGIDVGNASAPTLADIDGDGDLDLVVGERNGTLKYYQNTGTTSSPAYEAKTGDSNPFNGIDVGYSSSPILVDIDGDGDLDLVVGESGGTLKYYQNTGTTSNPTYEAKTGGSNPFNGIDVGYYSKPTLADIDGDGDLDLVVGEYYGTLKYYQNTGTTSNPAYEVKTGDSNPFNGIDVWRYSTPTLADIDGDGDLDLVVGERNGTLKYYQNTGTTSNPAYEAKTGDDNPFNGIDVGYNGIDVGYSSKPTLADIDGDGDLDLVVGEVYGTLKYYYNQQPSVDGQAPTPTATNSWTLSNIPAGQSAFKTDDVISLTLTMSETLKLNNTTGSKVVIAGKDFVLDKTASTTAGDKKLVFKYSVQAGDSIAATDFDIDNPTSDITLNNITDVAGNAPVFTADRVVLAKVEYIEKTGSGNNPFKGIDVGYVSVPILADIDGDGDLDLVVGEDNGTLKYYQNTGTTSNPAYEVKTGDSNPFNGIDVGYSSKPTLADIDGDGDLDLVVGEKYGTLKYYQNTGTTSNPAYEAKTGDSNPFNGIDVGYFSKPTLADIDGDGDLDLVVGEKYGTLKYYQNTGTTSNPAYEAKTGDSNPFNGIDVGYFSKPTLADIDGDGDLDLVVGEKYGTLKYYQNTGTTSNPAYEVKTGDDNPFNGIDVGDSSGPTLADIDDDGDLDLVVGKYDGTLKYYYNQQPSSVDGQVPTLTTQASVTLGETSDLVLDFSENIKAGTGSILIKNSSDVTVATINIASDTNKFSITNDKLTIDVSALGLTNNKLTVGSYYLEMNSGAITDMVGNDALGIAKNSNQWAFEIIVLTTDIVWAGADDNYINDSEKDATALSGKATGIGTLTITKIEFFEGSNTVGTAITSGLPAVAADGTWTLAHSAMPSELADGKTYTAVVTLSDGTNSAISTSTAVTYDTINPTPITTNPWTLSDTPAGQSAFKTGDVISLTLTMSETLKLNNTTGSKVVIAGKDFVLDKTASTTAGDKKLVFKYSVQAGDSIAATDFDIDNPTSDITLNNITDVAGNAPVFTADRVVLAKTKLEYIKKTGSGNNPFEGIDVGLYSTPTLADIDGDGDLDLVVGESNGTLKYYQNTGTTSNPAYEAKTGDDNPFNGIDAGYSAKPTLADIDGDGVLDLVVGGNDGTLKYYQNTGTTSNPADEAKTGDDNPFNGIDVGNLSAPTLADIDGDGDLDLVVGEAYGTLKYYQNTGTTSNPAYEAKTGDSNPFNGIDVGLYSAPTLADIDGDGDLDLVVGEEYGTLKYYQNTGTTSNPAYEAKTGDDNPFNGIDVGNAASPTLADIDGDGDLDLVAGKNDGTLKYYYNQQPSSVDTQAPTPITTNPWTLSNIPAGQSAFKTGDVISLTLTMSETLKLNNTTGSKVVIAGKDFVLDKTASTTAGDKKLVFKYSVQAGDSIAATDFDIDNPTSDITLNNITDVAGNAPVFTADRVVLAKTKLEYIEKTGSGNNPFNGIDVGLYSTPTLADIDGDGDLDLVVGENNGTLKYYQNTGTTSNPAYEAKTGDDNPFNGIDVGHHSKPTLADIDGDGDLDLVVGEFNGTLKYYQNTGTTSNPAYEAKTGGSNPFNGIDVGYFSTPLADIDGDGDLDLVVSEGNRTLKYYQNTGTTSNPAYEAKTGDDNPFNGIDVGYYSTPTLADIDGDGDLDLVVSEVYGTLKYYQNTGTTSNPAYEAKTGDSNPFNGIDVGYSSRPTLADIDGDGDLDLVAGKNDGTLKYYYNQQPSSVDGQAQQPLSVDEQVPTFTEKTSDTNVLGEPSNLVIEFSENIKTNGGIVEIWNSAEKVATISITNANISDTTLTLNPNSLTSGVYYIKMASGVITDTSGNDFAGIDNTSGKTWAFAYNFYIGTDNADTITGSAGDDTINGGAGSDIFVYANTDNGEDTITGFIFGAGGDKLDLKDFITASGNQATLFANIDKYITVSDTGTAGSAKLTIDADGTVTDDVADLVINLQGVSGIGGSSTPDTVALGHFITDNLILV